MSRSRYALGLDSSTQSLTAVVIDIEESRTVFEHSLDYAKDPRLNRFGVDFSTYTAPPRQRGEADQPPAMYLASLDAMFEDLVNEGVEMSRIAVINDSGQQHGHVYLNRNARTRLAELRESGSGEGPALADRLGDIFSYGTAPIWKTSNTVSQADALRRGAGGKEEMIRLSGSDSPLRFTGAVIRRVGEQFPDEYLGTDTVQLISSFLPAVLTGNARVPWDIGNSCGTSLMDYRARSWAPPLLQAAAEGLPGAAEELEGKLPGLVSPDDSVGAPASYFVERYGLSPACSVCAGSGDNPQSKVLVAGDLLSLGTSLVNMVTTDGETFDLSGYANGMYDGVGRPFMFGCRTNGALVWDRVREMNGLSRDDYGPADKTLGTQTPGSHLFLWQPDTESFPASKAFEPIRIGYDGAALERDYPGVIESSLAVVYLYSSSFARETEEPIHVTGGVTKVPEIMRRVAAIWKRPVVTVGTVGAALGAAVAGAATVSDASPEDLSAGLVPRDRPTEPIPDDVSAFHGEDGYLARLERAYERVIS